MSDEDWSNWKPPPPAVRKCRGCRSSAHADRTVLDLERQINAGRQLSKTQHQPQTDVVAARNLKHARDEKHHENCDMWLGHPCTCGAP